MKKFIVEYRIDSNEIYGDYYGDIIEAETEEEAIELYKAWLIENGCVPDEIDEWQYQVTDYDISNGDGGEGHDKARCY